MKQEVNIREKELRQAKIEQLITKQIISNQDDLLKALKKAGISATQATISRDIREMQIVKQQDGDGHLRYVVFMNKIKPSGSDFIRQFMIL